MALFIAYLRTDSGIDIRSINAATAAAAETQLQAAIARGLSINSNGVREPVDYAIVATAASGRVNPS